MKYRFSIVSAASTLITQWNLGLQTQSIPEGCSWTELVKDQNNFPLGGIVNYLNPFQGPRCLPI